MFELDSTQNWVDANPREVTYLATSINRPAVAPPERSPESAQAYICSVRKPAGAYVYIYLHLQSSNTGLLYRWSEGAVKPELVPTLQQNALEFTESMGFMIDDLRFPELPPEQQGELFAQTPVFHQDISFLKPPDESVSEIEVIEPEDAETSAEELVIEAVEESEAGSEEEIAIEVSESEVEEIALEVTTADEADPAIAIAEPEPSPVFLAEEDIALDAVPASSEVSEEDILLDQLETAEEPLPAVAVAESAEDSVSIELENEGDAGSAVLDALEAQEAEAPPLPSVPPAEPELEEQELEMAVEEEVMMQPESPPEPVAAPPAAAPSPRPAPMPVAAPPWQAEPPAEGEVSPEEWGFLVRLLAMM